MAYYVPERYKNLPSGPDEHFPRPTDPRALAQWELDVVDGTLVPEFHQVQVGWYDEKIEIEHIEVTNFSDPYPSFLEYRKERGKFPKCEEHLFWVRNPDLPKASRSIGTELVRR